jgi:very-short-patch-repair endonuclease
MTRSANPQRGEVLVAVLPTKADFQILQEQLWYRVPADKRPRRWPPQWLALYQTTAFGQDAVGVSYYGRVREITRVGRRDLFPEEAVGLKSDREYYRVELECLKQRETPIRPRRWRRIVFIPTTWGKFERAEEISDLFDDSPLEDELWAVLKAQHIAAERQWSAEVGSERYLLDFAVFCDRGNIDIEADGDSYHINSERAPRDNERNNALASAGWRVLRYTTHQIQEELNQYCLPSITHTINDLGGLVDDGPAARRFYASDEGVVQQLSLFDASPEYDVD